MRSLFFKAFIKSYLRLIYFDILMGRGNYQHVRNTARVWPVCSQRLSQVQLQQVLYGMDIACIWYRKEVLCLQRALATSTLLRDHGEPAEIVIGTQLMPHKTHAWVEINGKVVNDKPYMREKYLVMEEEPAGDASEVMA
jgi:hypothetical protein